MRKPFLNLLIGLTAVLLGLLHVSLKPGPSEERLRAYSHFMSSRTQWQGRLAPDFELRTTRGDLFRLSESVGKKTIVLNFFATWCGPCREEMPELNRYFNEHKNEPFLLLAIDAQEKKEQVDGFFQELKLDFPVGIDDGPILKQYDVGAYPTTVVIGVDGKVQFYEAGALKNANVAFDVFLRANRQLLQGGHAISTEAYRAQAAKPRTPPAPPARVAGPAQEKTAAEQVYALDARAKRIVARMDCPCGCDKRVEACTCHTSQNIKKTLAAGGFGNKSDAEIIKGLNKQFCMGDM